MRTLSGLLLLLSGWASAEVVEGTQIICDTTVKVGDGQITFDLMPQVGPIGAQRFVDLVNGGFFTNLPMFRAIPNFLIQFGINPDHQLQQTWDQKGNIEDDPHSSIPFTDGIVSYAGYGKNSRGTHLFMTLGNQPGLGKSPWEVPVARITKGIDVMHGVYTGYGDQVNQGRLNGRNGNEYLKKFPQLDAFKSCSVKSVSGQVEL